MSILIIFISIALLILLISKFKINAFLAFLIVSVFAGLLLGIDVSKISGSVQKGLGDMLGSLVVVVACGAMLGKLTADSGAAQQIATGLMRMFGERNMQWAMMITGFVIGIPLFYNVGFVLVIPLIFSVAYRFGLPPVYTGVPLLASLSVTHGFLPPHPAPTALVAQFHADLGTTLIYGIIIAIPTVILAGPLFASTLKNLKSTSAGIITVKMIDENKLPGLGISILSAMLPVILITMTTVFDNLVSDAGAVRPLIVFCADPAIAMVLSLAVATYTLGLRMGTSMKAVMDIYGEAIKDVAGLLLIMGGAGMLKQVLTDSGVSTEIGNMLNNLDIHPLLLAWFIACVIRVCVGSATVAGLTAAGIVAPLLSRPDVNPNLMVLSVGAGSLMFSHVNDGGFWLFKEYFNLSIRQTIRSWSLMESIVSVAGIIGVMVLSYII
ncbi:gluconate:H+ symporter [Chryseolinea sp. T2]|uniref:gluconate:H+ symporter n=1 Tax=Chryseolinea sp. T2 TaxID=3129255 RepID=UPI0030774147